MCLRQRQITAASAEHNSLRTFDAHGARLQLGGAKRRRNAPSRVRDVRIAACQAFNLPRELRHMLIYDGFCRGNLLAPRLKRLAEAGWIRSLHEVVPAVTCTAQASILTGRLPREHGIVGNGSPIASG